MGCFYHLIKKTILLHNFFKFLRVSSLHPPSFPCIIWRSLHHLNHERKAGRQPSRLGVLRQKESWNPVLDSGGTHQVVPKTCLQLISSFYSPISVLWMQTMKLSINISIPHLNSWLHLQGTVQNENAGPLLQELLRILRQWQQSIKPSTGPSKCGNLCNHTGHYPWSQPYPFNQALQSVLLAKGPAYGLAIWIWSLASNFIFLQQGQAFLSLAQRLAFLIRCIA